MNINTFFVDTGYFIALEASDDKNHTTAKIIGRLSFALGQFW